MNIDRSLNRKPAIRTVGITTAPAMAALMLLLIAHPAKAQTVLPSDAAADCTVSPAEFKSWFKDNVVKKDGEVKPANSLGFVANSECAFYRWSEQMFLWLTSPLASGRHTFNSNEFFAIGAPDPAVGGKRALIRQNTPEQRGFGPSLALALPQPTTVTDSTGRRRQVVTLEASAIAASPFVDKSNKPVDVASVAATAAGKPILLDRSNKVIDFKEAANGAPALTGPAASTVQLADTTVQVGNSQRLVTLEGAVVEIGQTESGQATLDVLISKNNAIVFYLLQVNDVYAYFKIGVGKNAIPPQLQFPSDVAALNLTEAFAGTVPAPNTMTSFGDRIALTMELKSSWVDVDTLPAAVRRDYLTIKADFPVYEAGDTLRKPTSMKSGQLALVGFHVVGSTLGHPEMIWATFEHVNNAPNLRYSYKTAAGPTVVRSMDGPGDWLFSSTGATEASLATRAKMSGENIVAAQGQTIGPVNVTRKFPWGSIDTDADTNTKIIAINNSVVGQLAADDVRRKYLLVGAIWTDGTTPDRNNQTNQRGTKALANATMETFIQNFDCFGCHQGDLLAPGLSRIWATITPEFPQ